MIHFIIRLTIASCVVFSISARPAQSAITPQLIQRCKSATVYISDSDRLASGSGVCIDTRGYFATNAHVVDAIDGKILVTVNPGESSYKQYEATVVARSAKDDLAILFVENAAQLTALELPDDVGVTEGQEVIALGFPFGSGLATDGSDELSVSVNVARVSALHSESGGVQQIEFDSQLNPGNSGGPVVNLDGQIIGIAQSILIFVSEKETKNLGVNFAVATRRLQALMTRPEIVVSRVQTPYLDTPLEIDFKFKQPAQPALFTGNFVN
ncbi:S1C family serine protease [Rubripirellula lacrimiformis]|uniref:S1C family serine protease n=1 Tax=Rubripirellula lacrimiformis TaxID=1930273 RepID=UPI001C54D524|nr:trypsin-like peptidase domain-containing protein [Rubripirellula lacrimiformis]